MRRETCLVYMATLLMLSAQNAPAQEQLVPDPNEPNDGFAEATSVTCPSFVSIDTSVDPSGDVDYYQLTGMPGSNVTIDIDTAELGSSLDSTLGVFDSSLT